MQSIPTRFAFAPLLALLGGLIWTVPAHAGSKHHHYRLVDLGTLGGPHSYGSVNGEGFALLNDSGVVASYSDLASSQLNAAPPDCYVSDCFEAHATEWKDGIPTDLGAL